MKANILVVDDEEGMRYTLGSFLRDEGHEVYTAASYDEALSVISRVDLDLIFSDIVLGGKTGIDVLRAVREKNPLCPVVMITGYPDVKTASEAVRLGAFDYIPKPVVQETLLDATERALQHKAAVDKKEKCRTSMETVFRSAKDAIISVDQHLVVLDLNESAEKICRLSRDAVGHALGSEHVPCAGGCLELIREAAEKQEMIHERHVECEHGGGDSQVLNVSVFPLLDDRNAFCGAAIVVKDEAEQAGEGKQREERRGYRNLVGAGEPMQRLYDLIESLHGVRSTVLIVGESGTGKELIADALHHGREGSLKPFVKVNCGALPENLLESELFGHVKGAFTGAAGDKVGRFQRAGEGTIFLDEIGNISPKMQLSLLRVLQEKEFERVGDATPIRVDVRVIAATNQDLLEKIRLGEFREDLYYRLNVMKVIVPPLRERREDIPLLVEHFLERFGKKFGREIQNVSGEVMDVFMAYPWPGNVRELEHALEHAFILCRGRSIGRVHLPPELNQFMAAAEKKDRPFATLSGEDDRNTILKALQRTAWNKAKAARILGISKRTIFRKIKEYNLAEQETP